MAIIACPSCQKQISDKAKSCNHCDAPINAKTAQELESQGCVNRIERAQTLQTQTFLALLLFVGGFSLWYWKDTFDNQWYNFLGQGMIATGFVWYLVNRVRFMFNKRK